MNVTNFYFNPKLVVAEWHLNVEENVFLEA